MTPLDFLEHLLVRLPISSQHTDISKIKKHAQAFISLAARGELNCTFYQKKNMSRSNWWMIEPSMDHFAVNGGSNLPSSVRPHWCAANRTINSCAKRSTSNIIIKMEFEHDANGRTRRWIWMNGWMFVWTAFRVHWSGTDVMKCRRRPQRTEIGCMNDFCAHRNEKSFCKCLLNSVQLTLCPIRRCLVPAQEAHTMPLPLNCITAEQTAMQRWKNPKHTHIIRRWDVRISIICMQRDEVRKYALALRQKGQREKRTSK